MGEWRSWRSNPPHNYFSPRFSVDMWFDQLDESLVDSLLEEAKKNEDLYLEDRWEHYNTFTWDCECMDILGKVIQKSYLDFCKKLMVRPERVWIRGWIYPQKRGMTLNRHYHAIHENSYLSGNICLTQNDTTTNYDIPYLGWIKVSNRKGDMTLFPSSLPHAVDQLEDEERYSLAFDLITEQGMDYFWCNNTNECDPLLLAVEL